MITPFEEELREKQARLEFLRGVAAMRRLEAWKQFEAGLWRLRDEEIMSLVHGSASPPRVARRQGRIQLLDSMLRYGGDDITPEGLAELQKQVQGLQDHIRHLQNHGLIEPPDHHEDQLRERLRESTEELRS